MEEIEANAVNTVHRLELTSGDCVYLKIQFRTGFSLEVEHRVIQILRNYAVLPTPEFSYYTETLAEIGHPCLLSSELPGNHGRDYFESTREHERLSLLRQFGELLRSLHELPVAAFDWLPRKSLEGWQNQIRRFLSDGTLRRELARVSASFQDDLELLLDELYCELPVRESVVLWGDAALHNLLISRPKACPCVTAIHDFENARLGPPQEDLLHVLGDFGTRNPRNIYGKQQYVEAFKAGYDSSDDEWTLEPAETHAREAVRMAIGIWWFWDALGMLHPRTAEWMQDVLDSLAAVRSSIDTDSSQTT